VFIFVAYISLWIQSGNLDTPSYVGRDPYERNTMPRAYLAKSKDG